MLLPPFKAFHCQEEGIQEEWKFWLLTIRLLQKVLHYLITLDESSDIVDEEQMSTFVCFLDIESKVFREQLLAVLLFKGNSR